MAKKRRIGIRKGMNKYGYDMPFEWATDEPIERKKYKLVEDALTGKVTVQKSLKEYQPTKSMDEILAEIKKGNSDETTILEAFSSLTKNSKQCRNSKGELEHCAEKAIEAISEIPYGELWGKVHTPVTKYLLSLPLHQLQCRTTGESYISPAKLKGIRLEKSKEQGIVPKEGGITSCLDKMIMEAPLATSYYIYNGPISGPEGFTYKACYSAIDSDVKTSCLDKILDLATITDSDLYTKAFQNLLTRARMLEFAKTNSFLTRYILAIERERGSGTVYSTIKTTNLASKLISPMGERGVDRAALRDILTDMVTRASSLQIPYIIGNEMCEDEKGKLQCVELILNTMYKVGPHSEKKIAKRYTVLKELLTRCFDSLPNTQSPMSLKCSGDIPCLQRVLEFKDDELRNKAINNDKFMTAVETTFNCRYKDSAVKCVDYILLKILDDSKGPMGYESDPGFIEYIVNNKETYDIQKPISFSEEGKTKTLTPFTVILTKADPASFIPTIDLSAIDAGIKDTKITVLDNMLNSAIISMAPDQRSGTPEERRYHYLGTMHYTKSQAVRILGTLVGKEIATNINKNTCTYHGSPSKLPCVQKVLELAELLYNERESHDFVYNAFSNLNITADGFYKGRPVPAFISPSIRSGGYLGYPNHSIRCAMMGRTNFDSIVKSAMDYSTLDKNVNLGASLCGTSYGCSGMGDDGRSRVKWLDACACRLHGENTLERASCFESMCYTTMVSPGVFSRFTTTYNEDPNKTPKWVEAWNNFKISVKRPDEVMSDDLSGVYSINPRLSPDDINVRDYTYTSIQGLAEFIRYAKDIVVDYEATDIDKYKEIEKSAKSLDKIPSGLIKEIGAKTTKIPKRASPEITISILVPGENPETPEERMVISSDDILKLDEYSRNINSRTSPEYEPELVRRYVRNNPNALKNIREALVKSKDRDFHISVNWVDVKTKKPLVERVLTPNTEELTKIVGGKLSSGEFKKRRAELESRGEIPYMIRENTPSHEYTVAKLLTASKFSLPSGLKNKLERSKKRIGEHTKPLILTITTHPRDIMRASTCQMWGSCIKMDGGGGMNSEALKAYRDFGSWIAFLKENENSPFWLARMLVHRTTNSKSLAFQDKSYNTETVEKIYGLPEHQRELIDAVKKVAYDKGYNQADYGYNMFFDDFNRSDALRRQMLMNVPEHRNCIVNTAERAAKTKFSSSIKVYVDNLAFSEVNRMFLELKKTKKDYSKRFMEIQKSQQAETYYRRYGRGMNKSAIILKYATKVILNEIKDDLEQPYVEAFVNGVLLTISSGGRLISAPKVEECLQVPRYTTWADTRMTPRIQKKYIDEIEKYRGKDFVVYLKPYVRGY